MKIKLLTLAVFPLVCAFGDSQHIPIDTKPQELPKSAEQYLQLTTGSVADPERAKSLIMETLCQKDGTLTADFCKDTSKPIPDFVVINVISFKDVPKASSAPQQIDKENWYVFREKSLQKWSYDDFASRNRLFGVKEFYFLYVLVHVKAPIAYTPAYDILIQQKTPTNVQDAFTAASVFVQVKNSDEPYLNYFGGGKASIDYSTSTITITPSLLNIASLKAATFNNEGTSWWDVSFAVPITAINQTSFDLTNNTITASKASSENVFAVLDGYIKKRDLLSTNFE